MLETLSRMIKLVTQRDSRWDSPLSTYVEYAYARGPPQQRQIEASAHKMGANENKLVLTVSSFAAGRTEKLSVVVVITCLIQLNLLNFLIFDRLKISLGYLTVDG